MNKLKLPKQYPLAFALYVQVALVPKPDCHCCNRAIEAEPTLPFEHQANANDVTGIKSFKASAKYCRYISALGVNAQCLGCFKIKSCIVEPSNGLQKDSL